MDGSADGFSKRILGLFSRESNHRDSHRQQPVNSPTTTTQRVSSTCHTAVGSINASLDHSRLPRVCLTSPTESTQPWPHPFCFVSDALTLERRLSVRIPQVLMHVECTARHGGSGPRVFSSMSSSPSQNKRVWPRLRAFAEEYKRNTR